jgi:hypothetical protein
MKKCPNCAEWLIKPGKQFGHLLSECPNGKKKKIDSGIRTLSVLMINHWYIYNKTYSDRKKQSWGSIIYKIFFVSFPKPRANTAIYDAFRRTGDLMFERAGICYHNS